MNGSTVKILALLVLAFQTAPLTYGSCTHGWTAFQGFCYHVSPYVTTWHIAQHMCSLSGAHLVKITSATENDFVLYLSRKFAPHRQQMWIGLGYWHSDKKFHWRDGSLPQYTNWAPYEPSSNAREPCGHMWTDQKQTVSWRLAGTWNDLLCSVHSRVPCGFVCKKIK